MSFVVSQELISEACALDELVKGHEYAEAQWQSIVNRRGHFMISSSTSSSSSGICIVNERNRIIVVVVETLAIVRLSLRFRRGTNRSMSTRSHARRPSCDFARFLRIRNQEPKSRATFLTLAKHLSVCPDAQVEIATIKHQDLVTSCVPPAADLGHHFRNGLIIVWRRRRIGEKIAKRKFRFVAGPGLCLSAGGG